MKKRGFSLIELLASVAILTIGVIGVTGVLSNSINTFKRCEIKLETAAYTQGICEYYISQSYERILALCMDEQISFYVYFDNIDELVVALDNIIQGIGTVEESFSNCNEFSNDKKYGGYINLEFISKDSLLRTRLYNIKVKVWEFNFGDTSESNLSVSKGVLDI